MDAGQDIAVEAYCTQPTVNGLRLTVAGDTCREPNRKTSGKGHLNVV